MAAPKGNRCNPDGRPKSDTVRLTKAARERFERQLAEGLDDIFKALFDAATNDKDVHAMSLLVNRAVPLRRGVPINIQHRPLTTPSDCALAFDDLFRAIAEGKITADEGNAVGALIERRAALFHTVELQDEIAALKEQIAALAPRTAPALRIVE